MKDIEVFNSKSIRGLMKPSLKGQRKIEYRAPAGTSLMSYLKSGLRKNDFYIVFAQFIECIKKIERYDFNINNLVLDINYVFYNLMTKEVQFIYQPISNCETQNNIFAFIYGMLQVTVLNQNEDRSFLDNLYSFTQKTEFFSTSAFENYLMQAYPQVYKSVKRTQPGDSVSLNSTGRTYFEKKYDSEAPEEYTYTDQTQQSFGYDDPGPTGLLYEEEEYDQRETDVLEYDGDDYYEQETGILYESGFEPEPYGGTTVIENNQKIFPYLVRLNFYEKIDVDKPVFRIGKEKSYVDYFVMNNNAVSRIHADIITENNRCYIKDNNSTNHTFVNGTMVGINQKIEIFDGDAIMIANEPFEFHKSF